MTRIDQLRKSLEMLASPASRQLSYLSSISDIPSEMDGNYNIDELILEFDDIACATNDMFSHGELTELQRKAILDFDNFLSSVGAAQPKSVWTSASLQHSQEWEEIRAKARICLKALN